MRTMLLVTYMLLAMTVLCFGGQTGKISGVVTDEATGEGLVGVNIVVDGLGLGASTDLNGRYFILNVPPGRYDVRCMMIGYATIVSEGVTVAMGLTTPLNIAMSSEVMEMAEVRVTSTRPAVVHDLSASQLYVKEETIEALPVDNVTSIIGLQAGVEGSSVRGGSRNETAFIVDGFQLSDRRDNSPGLSIPLSAIKEVQIQSGGFNAEYGNIRSGVINAVTAEGDVDGYSGTVTYYYSPPAPKNFGMSIYDPDSYYLRPYLDEEVAWTGTDGEDYSDLNNNFEYDPGEPFEDYNGDGIWNGWDVYTRNQYPSFEGWNEFSEALLQDSNPQNDLTPAQAQQKFIWEHRRAGFITKPDYTLDFGFGGPMPLLSEYGNTRFHLSHKNSQNMFVFPLSRDSYRSNTTHLHINTDISDQIKLTLTGVYTEESSVSPYAWTTTPTGYVLSSTYSVAVRANDGSNAVFMPGYFSPSDIFRANVGAKWNHMLNERSFYELIYQYSRNKYWTFGLPLRDTTRHELSPGLWVDEEPYGYDPDTWMNLGRDNSLIKTHSLKTDYTNQVNERHLVKAGLLFMLDEINVNSFTESGKDTWRRSQVYDRKPFRFAAYLQDKLEHEGFVANIGLRAEYNNPNAPIYILDPYDLLLAEGLGSNLEENAEEKDAKRIWTLSPRLGISHPITVRSKLYFNYTHNHSEPSSTYRYRLQRENNGQVTSIGNPNLELERTISYELGYEHAIGEIYLLRFATYYKDISKQAGWVRYTSVDQSVNYQKPENNNYEDIRGLELTLSKDSGDWLTGFLNYSYMVSTEGYFGLTEYYQNPVTHRNEAAINPKEERPEPRPYARANIVFHSPKNFGPRMAGFAPLANWRLSFLASYKAGSTFNYNPTGNHIHRIKWVDFYNINARLAKNFDARMGDLEFFVDINNLLNTKRLSDTGFRNSMDRNAYLASLRMPFETGLEHGNDVVGDYRDWDTPYTPFISIDSLSNFQGSPPSQPIYWEESSDSYHQWNDLTQDWESVSEPRVDDLMEKKAYIDMPNIQSMTFLSPRQITAGIRIKF